MNNTLLIIFMVFVLVVTFSNADYLNTKTTNQCVYNVTPYQNNKGLCYTKRSNNLTYCSTTLKYSGLIDGYVYKNTQCVLKNDLQLTGLTQEQWNYMLAFLAHAMGLTMLFLVNLLAVNTAKFRS